MEDYITFVIIAIAVIEILLLVKFWNLAEDVHIIKETMTKDRSVAEIYTAVKLHCLGRTEEAKKFVIDKLEAGINQILEQRTSKYIDSGQMQKQYDTYLKTYESLYRYLGSDLPQEYKSLNFEKIMNTYSEINNNHT